MSLRPHDLPKLRDQTLGFLDDPSASIRTGTGAENQPGLDALADHLRVGGLYWATAEMTALALSSGSQLAAARWATADRPTACGLLMFDGGVGHLDSHGASIPVEGCVWGPYDGECLIWLLLSRRRLAQESQLQLVAEKIPPLIPSYGLTIPIGTDPVPMAEVDPAAPQPVVGALAASWLLMQQPTLVDHSHVQPDKSVRRAYARRHRPDPEVTLVDLRSQYVPQNQGDGANEGNGQRYRHRWVVSGHWRNQPHGPGREQRRQQWIPSYVKGPDGAPLLSTERVNVWRR